MRVAEARSPPPLRLGRRKAAEGAASVAASVPGVFPAPIAGNGTHDGPRTSPASLDDRRDLLRSRHPEAVRVVRRLRPGWNRAVLRVAGAAAGPAPRHRRGLDGDR